jgi:hypothetical protein
MKPASKPVLFILSVLSLVAALAVGCADSTEKKIEQKTDAAIAGTADAMNAVAKDVKTVSTNVAAHVTDFSTNAWDKTKSGAKKVVEVTTNVVKDIK